MEQQENGLCAPFDSDACDPSLQVYLFAEALAEGAVKMGMPSALAHNIASQTVLVSFTVCAFVSLSLHQQFSYF